MIKEIERGGGTLGILRERLMVEVRGPLTSGPGGEAGEKGSGAVGGGVKKFWQTIKVVLKQGVHRLFLQAAVERWSRAHQMERRRTMRAVVTAWPT